LKKSELRDIIREEIAKIKRPYDEKAKSAALNEGIISSLITSIVMMALKGKSSQINSMIDPVGRRDLIKASDDFSKSVQRYRDFLNRPDIKKDLEKSGLKPEDSPFYNEW